MARRSGLIALLFSAVLMPLRLDATPSAQSDLPAQVMFPSLDGKTMLTGYLFRPWNNHAAKVAAIVMMHGRAGAYSSLANGRYDASTLSKRHAFWGHFWADHGYAALLIDSFGPRGYPQGFTAHSYDARPDELNEVTVRPLDAYGALAYLRALGVIDGRRVALQGWSNGGSATIATMSDETLASLKLGKEDGFQGAVAFYPACGLHGLFQSGYHPYAPLRILSGSADEEVSARHCAKLVDAARPGSDIAIEVYDGATHDFDDPGRKRRSVPENVAATEKAVPATFSFVTNLLGR